MAAYDSPGESADIHTTSGRVQLRGETEEAIDVRPFHALRDVDFYADAEQVQQWAMLNDRQFEQATLDLQLKSLLVGIDQATDVGRELMVRAERAQRLAGQLREAANAASHHGLATPSEF